MRLPAFILAVAIGLGGCSHATVQTQSLYQGNSLPRPAVVYVRDFVVAPADVALDSGRIARLRRAFSGSDDGSQQQAAAQGVVDALSDTLVADITKMGLTARRISADTVLPAGENAALVDGNIVSIDEGNRAKRVVIGFGAGASKVDAKVALTYLAPAAEQRLAEFQASGNSGSAPGMAATMGAGAAVGAASTATSAVASGGVQTVRETQSATVSHDADNIGAKIAEALRPIFTQQGWIAVE